MGRTNVLLSRLPGLLRALGFCGLLLAGFLPAQTNWWNPSWAYYKVVSNLSPTIYGGGATSSLSNFPVLLRLSNDADLMSVHRADGGDVTFVGDDGSQLFHEIEYFNKSTGDLVAWVCLPQFTNKTRFRIFYSNAGNPTFAGSNTFSSLSGTYSSLRAKVIWTNVWDTNYLVVAHFAETSGNATDSGRFSANVTAQGAAVSPSAYPNGGFGPGFAFGPATVNTGVQFANGNNVKWTNGTWSVSLWMRPDAYPSQATAVGTQEAVWAMYASSGGGGGSFSRWHNNTGLTAGDVDGASHLGTGAAVPGTLTPYMSNWTHWGTENTKASNFPFTNGFRANAGAAGTAIPNGTYPFCVGGGVGSVSFRGIIDEARLSFGMRGSNWITTEYSNIVSSTNGGFFVVGPSVLVMAANVTSADYPYPVSNQSLQVKLTNLLLPFRKDPNPALSNYITNVMFFVSNVNLGSDLLVTNLRFTGDVEDTNYSFWTVPTNASTYYTWAWIFDQLGNVGVSRTNAALVVSESNVYDMRYFSVRTTNAGVAIDLFNGTSGSAQPGVMVVWRNGVQVTTANPGPGVYVDDGDFFFGDTVSYQVSNRYTNAGISWTTNFTFTTALPNVASASLNATNGSIGNLLRRLTYRLSVSNADLGSDTVWAFVVPAGQAMTPGASIGSAQDEWVVSNLTAPTSTKLTGASLSMQLKLQGIQIPVPGVSPASYPTLGSKERLVLGQYVGGKWRTLATAYTLTADRITLTATVTNAGRFGLIYGNSVESLSEVQITRLKARRIVLGSSGSGSLDFEFKNPAAKKVSVRLTSSEGRTVRYVSGLTGLSWTWDGTTDDGLPVRPGLYLYQIRMEGENAITGTFYVASP